MSAQSEPEMTAEEAIAYIRATIRAKHGAGIPEIEQRERFRTVLARHGRVTLDELEQTLDELMDAV